MIKKISISVLFIFVLLSLIFTNINVNLATNVQSTARSESILDTKELDNGIMIHLKAAEFDPLSGDPNIPQNLEISHENVFYLVQCIGPIQQEWYRTISNSGAEILGYIPQYTYIIRMEKEVKHFIEQLPFIRWVGIYHPAYKIDDDLLFKYGEIRLNVVVFRGVNGLANLEAVRNRIIDMGGRILHNGDDNFIIQAQIDALKVKDIAFIPEVEWIDEWQPPVPFMDHVRVFTGAETLHNLGINGTGIVGGIRDGGIDRDHVEFQGRIIIDEDVSEDAHGTCTFGIVFAKGINPRAEGMLSGGVGVISNYNYGTITDSVDRLVDNWGGLFQSNSWGYIYNAGEYTSYTEENDQIVYDRDISFLWSAGNGGETAKTTAVAKNVICVGALWHYDNQDRTDDAHNGNAGNTGPPEDGRVKPDIVGPYDAIYTTDVTGGGGYSSGDYYDSMGGTSGAAPVAAGSVGLLYQMYRDDHFGNNPAGSLPHAATVKAILIADAYQYEFAQGDRFEQGWGLVDVGNAYNIGENHLIDNEFTPLRTGDSVVYKVEPTGSHPLKISLVWTDVPGESSSSKHLINDLNLKVTDPNGLDYHGNYGLMDSKWSSSAGEVDHINNVENVFIENPIPGEWTIEVKGGNIPMDGISESPEIDQAFGLVASGVVKQEHDLKVQTPYIPRTADKGEEVQISVSVSNIGSNSETNVRVNLFVDDDLIDSTNIGFIDVGEIIETNFVWTAEEEKDYNIEVEVEPVSGETSTNDNNIDWDIRASYIVGKILVDDGHGTDLQNTLFYNYIEMMGLTRYKVFHTSQTITEDLLSNYDVLIIANPTQDYSLDEEVSIENFVGVGGGLLVIGENEGDIYDGLTDYAGIDWGTPYFILFSGNTSEMDENHEITEDVETLFFGSHQIPLTANGPAEEIAYTWDGVVYDRLVAAASNYSLGKVVAIADEECLDNLHIDLDDNRIFGENIIKWLTNEWPVPIIDSPLDGSTYNIGDLIPFDGSSSYDPDGDALQYYWYSNINGVIGELNTFTSALSGGEHTIFLTVSDSGGKSGMASIMLSVLTPPEVTIQSPNDGALLNAIVDVSGTAWDRNGAVQIVKVQIDSWSWHNAKDTSASGNWSTWRYSWNTEEYSDGDHKISVRAIDDDGFYSDIDSITVGVDNSPPSIIFGPEVISKSQTTAVIEWETDEPADSHVDYGNTTDYGFSEEDTTFSTSHSIKLTGLTHSNFYYYRVKSTDALGNGPAEAVNTFETKDPPDTFPPIAEAGVDGSVDEDSPYEFDATGSYDLEDGTIIWYNWSFGDGFYLNGTNPKPSHTYDNAGVYQVTLKVTDTAGNSAIDTVEVTVNDVTKPEIRITSPENDDVVSGIVLINVDTLDNVGISEVKFYIDDNFIGKDTSYPYSIEWDPDSSEYPDDIYIIKASALDTSGNENSTDILVTLKNNGDGGDGNDQGDGDGLGDGDDGIEPLDEGSDSRDWNFIFILLGVVVAGIVLLLLLLGLSNRKRKLGERSPAVAGTTDMSPHFYPLIDISCPNCQTAFEVPSGPRPLNVQCPNCLIAGVI